jgi:RND family efflux transporter MFP subunit
LTRRALVGAIIGAAGLAGIAALRAPSAPRVPIHVVARGPFRNEVQALGVLQAVRSTPLSVPSAVQRQIRVAWLAPAGPVKKGDPVVVFDATEIERQQADGRSDRESAASKRRKAVVEGDQKANALGLDRAVAEQELRNAEDVAPSDEQIFSRNEIVSSRLDRGLLQQRVATSDAKRKPTERLAAADVALADIESQKADLRVKQAERSLEALRVTAPHDGILIYPLSWRGDAVAVGDTVSPGQSIAELPDLSALQARVFVLEGDGAGLTAGLTAVVDVEGQPGLSFPGRVSRVEAFATTRERQSPVKYFETTIAFEGMMPPALKPGQRVRARILVDEIKDALTIPRGALFEKEGRRVAYRLTGRRFEPVEVSVERRSLAKIVIAKGLQPGDRVALDDPERQTSRDSAPPGAAGPAQSQGR